MRKATHASHIRSRSRTAAPQQRPVEATAPFADSDIVLDIQSNKLTVDKVSVNTFLSRLVLRLGTSYTYYVFVLPRQFFSLNSQL